MQARLETLVGLTFCAAALGCTGGGGGGGSTAGASTATTQAAPVTSSATPTTSAAPVVTAPKVGFALGPSMAQPRGLHTATALPDGRVLIVGGLDARSNKPTFVTESEIYDPLTNTFSLLSAPNLGGNPGGYMVATSGSSRFKVPRYQHVAVLMADGRVLIAGGYGAETLDASGNPVVSDLATAYTFTPATNTFAQVGSLGTPRSSPQAVAIPGGGALIAGGFNGALNNGQGGTVPTSEIFDPQQNAFIPVGDMSVPRQNFGLAVVGGNAIAVGGLVIATQSGQNAPQQFVAPGSELMGAQGTWSQGPKPASDRFATSFDVLANGDALLAGGEDANGPVLAVERFSATANAFATVAQLSEPREQHGSGANSAGDLLAGGISVNTTSNTFTTLADADWFDATKSAVTNYPMAHARNGCAVTALPGGTFLVTGGFENGTSDPTGLDGTSVAPSEIFTAPH